MTQLRLRAERRLLRTLTSIPDAVLRRLAGPPPINDRGTPLDPQIHALLRGVSLRGQPLDVHRADVGRQRAVFERDAPIADLAKAPMHRVEDRYVPTHDGAAIKVRVYEPTPRGATPRPACLYAHGGGFVLGSLESHDGVCRHLAAEADCVVVAVDYRLAPEHKFPGPSLDAVAAVRWIAAHAGDLGIDPARIAVAGDSAGGNIAAVVALSERGRAVAPCFQLLVYPVADFTHSTESYRLFREGFLLTAASMRWFKEHHLADIARDERDPRGSILHADDVTGAAPAYIATAGFDPLRDEGEHYARKLEGAGVLVELAPAEGMIHGFFSMGGAVRAARAEIDRAAGALSRALRVSPDSRYDAASF